MQNFKWIILVFFGFSLQAVSAQETLTKGTIKYELTEANSDNPQVQSQLAMMEGSTMTIFVMEDAQLTKMNMMNGMMQQRILMDKDESGVEMYIDMMGQKIKTVMPVTEESESEETNITNIEYFPDDRKEIAGYDAYKAVITNKVGEQEVQMTAYITDKLKLDADIIKNVKGTDKLKGLPLEYTINVPELSMTYTAKEVSKDVDPAEFDFDKTGYKEMSPEEMQQMGGGMGGF